MDVNKKDWKDAVIKDQLVWYQYCDLEISKGKIQEDFGIIAIPSNFLIDKDGIIIDKDLKGDRIDSVLAKLFENN